MVANDLIAASTKRDMQDLISIAKTDSSNERDTFSKMKTKILLIDDYKQEGTPRNTFDSEEIAESNDELHLGRPAQQSVRN